VNYLGDYIPLKSRGILEDTCKKFNVRFNGDTRNLQFPYYDKTGRLVAYKQRSADKDFSWVGKNEEHTLFGQQLFGGGKSVVVTEGEMDALSVWQARANWPVVSVPNGAQAAKKALQHQLKWLLGFDEVVLFFDNDEAGIAAAEECASLFPHEKVFLARMSGDYKDANDAIMARDPEAIRQAIWNKSHYQPKTIVDGRGLFDLVTKPLHGKDAEWPFTELNRVTGGLRLGELVTVTAGSGVGKSTFCGEVAQHLVDQQQAIGYIALEESIQRTALRLMTVKANKPLHLNNQHDDAVLRSAFDLSVGSGRVYLREGFGSVDPEAILSDIRFLTMAHGVKWIILDHLSILMSGLDTGDERKTIDVTMTKLRSFVEETGIGMLLISHLRRPQGDKGHEDGGQVSLGQLRGSHSIVQLSDLVVALERNLSSGDDFSNLRVLKNRFNGQTGPAGTVHYNTETGRMQESFDFSPTTSTDDNTTDYF
jgi:twinkle protein